MIKSMTGYGRAEISDGKRNISCEIRSVNHRYCDIAVRSARRYAFAEEAVRRAIKETVSRGKLDVSVSVESVGEADLAITLNLPVARQYCDKLKELAETFGLSGDISPELLASMPDVLNADPDIENEEELTASIVRAVRGAAASLDAMRRAEGRELGEDLLARGTRIRGLIAEIEERACEVPGIYAEKLRARIKELIGGSVELPEERIAAEAAIFADKCSIQEELTRLSSHMDQMEKIVLSGDGPAGKRLDFLVQEMNREANTIGSKANDLSITECMLEIKNEVENIREQVQNVE